MNQERIDTEELLSVINTHNKYAKYIPEKQRRENWEEIVNRNKEMHLKKFSQLKNEIEEAYKLVYDKKILPSMRSLQFAGKPIELNPSRIYNCSYAPVDHYKIFGEAIFLLLGGCGFGFSVQKHHVEKLPPIRKPLKSRRFLAGDSIEGWSEAVNSLLKAYLGNGSKPIFDYRDIRPKGARLVTAGGKAPGPAPLKICLTKIETLLESKNDGEQLKPIECHDIICHLADAVLAGGIRRAACISLFSFDDTEMLHAKHGNWWELNPQRGRANNSVVIMRSKITKDDFDKLWKIIKDSRAGEPGIFFTNDKDMGGNPCLEISLKNHSFCNLVEVNVSNIDSQEDLNNRVKMAAFIATLQSSYTDFHFLRSIWKKNAEDESLIGVSITGISDGEVLQYNLKEASEIVKLENERISNLIGINKAKRTTCVKPSGNCLSFSSRIKTNKGNLTLEEIFNFNGYNINDYINKNDYWLDIKNNDLKIYNSNNEEESINRLYINGFSEVYEIEMEDNKKFTLTGNHKLLTKNGVWKKIKNLNKNDEIINFD